MGHYMKDYIGHFYPIWIKHWVNIEPYGPLLPPTRKSWWGNVGWVCIKTDQGWNSSSVTLTPWKWFRAVLDWLFYWWNSNKIKMASNIAINTELVRKHSLWVKIYQVDAWKYFYVDFREEECIKITKSILFKWNSLTCYFQVAMY